jgi:hypothetical protein
MIDNVNSAEDATGYYATPMVRLMSNLPITCPDKSLQRSGLTWSIGVDVDSRTKFAHDGSLGNSEDTQFRVINECVS